jgi:chaperone modulatory protein CbpM
MILTRQDFLAHANLDRQTLEIWIEEEWLIPVRTDSDLTFSEADLARAKLIRDLIDDLGVNSEGVGIVLHLLDQVHGLRRALAEVLKSAHPKAGTSGGEQAGS